MKTVSYPANAPVTCNVHAVSQENRRVGCSLPSGSNPIIPLKSLNAPHLYRDFQSQ